MTIAELISAVPSHNPTFVSRNFTDAEAAYCYAQPSPPSSFAARWAGKEAVFKSLGVKSKGAAASLRDIEILNDPETGAPTVTLHGDAKAEADKRDIVKVLLSLSHSEVSIDFASYQHWSYMMYRPSQSPLLKLRSRPDTLLLFSDLHLIPRPHIPLQRQFQFVPIPFLLTYIVDSIIELFHSAHFHEYSVCEAELLNKNDNT
jgi:phosphopantetheine--protein transferase-like protein